MAGLMDMLGKKPEAEGVSSYQKTIMREIARKLAELEEQNDQNTLLLEELRKQQAKMIQKMDMGVVSEQPDTKATVDEWNALSEKLCLMDEQMKANFSYMNQSIEALQNKMEQPVTEDENADDFADKLDTMKLSLEDTIHKEMIKCFRNVQGAIEEQGDGKSYDINSLKKYLKTIIWFQLFTIAVVVLNMLGIL